MGLSIGKRLGGLGLTVALALLCAEPGLGQEAAAELRTALLAAQGGGLVGGEPLSSPAAVARFYEARRFLPAWVGDSRPGSAVEDLRAAVRAAPCHGLRREDYHARAIWADPASPTPPGGAWPTRAGKELLLTDAFLTLARHLGAGRGAPEATGPGEGAAPSPTDPAAALEQALASGRVKETLEGLAPSHPGYRALCDALTRYRALADAGGWAPVSAPPVLRRGDSGQAVLALRRRLAAEGYLESPAGPDTMDAAVVAAVGAYQARNGLDPDGVVGRATWRALNAPAAARVGQIRANLERWRRRAREPERRHLRVNAAAFLLEMMEEGRVALAMAVVVGRSRDPTPAFSADLTQIVLNPSWNVPPRIAAEELLPEVRRDPGCLARKGFRVLSGWAPRPAELDPAQVDWATVSLDRGDLHFQQAPGPENPLGRIKFLLPNRHHVYLHDTPARSLFRKARRDFSHGCIRVSEPRRLAEYLLGDDPRWPPGALRAALEEGRERAVTLREPVPVHVEYFTAWAEDAGPVHFREDIYGLDASLLAEQAGTAPDT